MTDGAAGLYIVLCECMCEGKEGDRGRERGGVEMLRDMVRPRAEKEARVVWETEM